MRAGLLLHHARIAARTLLKSPGFTAVAVCALALGIGANTAMFSMVNTVLLRALPYRDADRLVEIWEKMPPDTGIPVAYPDYLDWRSANRVFEDMAISATFSDTLTGRGPAERIGIGYVSQEFLGLLGVQPALGRAFLPEDDRPNARRVVMLSHALWQSRFGGDAGVLGRSVAIGGAKYDVIGVLPASFRYHRGADVYVPFALCIESHHMVRGNHNNTFVIARVKPGVSLEQARAQMDAIAKRLEREYPVNNGIGAKVVPLRELLAGGARRRLLVLLGAVALVLLIACANVANLLLARSSARRKEMAIRTAVGASRAQIVTQLLSESLLLALAGGALGIAVAQAAFRVLTSLLPWGFEAADVRIDATVLAFTFAAACVAGIVFGLAPALHASSVSLSEAMKEGGRGAGQGRGRTRTRTALVVAEVAMAFVLLAGAGLLMRSLYGLLSVSPGYPAEHLLTMRINWPYSDPDTAFRLAAFHRRLTGRVRALPGVREAGGVSWLGLAGDGYSSASFYRADRPVPGPGKVPDAAYHAATPEYFRTMGIRLLKGRLFTEADGRIPEGMDVRRYRELFSKMRVVAVISETMARRFWPGEDPIGKTFHFGPPGMNGPLVEIAGVVSDIKQNDLTVPSYPEFYISMYQWASEMTLVVRTHGDPMALAGAIRKTVAELDPNVPLTSVRSMETVIAESVAPRRMNVLLIGSFAALALVLATVGIYGVLSYAVTQRAHEIGIRMALGASRARVLGRVVCEAAGMALAGVGIGVLGGLALTRVIASMLFGVGAADPATFAAVGAILFATALVAGYIPARRATRVDPVIALRAE